MTMKFHNNVKLGHKLENNYIKIKTNLVRFFICILFYYVEYKIQFI